MSFVVAAAGTGGHVFPGLAVAEALVDAGIAQSDVLTVGGSRLAAKVFPEAGYPYLELELRGLKRSFSVENLGIPGVVRRATRAAEKALLERSVGVVLAMGGYVSVPVGWAAHRIGIPFYLQEQNAHAGLANKVMGRWAVATFTSFEETEDARHARYLGNPIRREFSGFARSDLRHKAMLHYEMEPTRVTIGVVGGSLGARAVNEAVLAVLGHWEGHPIQVLHLAGSAHAEQVSRDTDSLGIPWRVIAFEGDMPRFFAACDVVIARAGGMVAEMLATGCPAVLIPGGFGSSGHQSANAASLVRAGAARSVLEGDLDGLRNTLLELTSDPGQRLRMSNAARGVARPDAANNIAAELVAAHG